VILESHELSPPLDALVESIFHFKDSEPDHSIERLVPTGHSFIIFELDGIERHTFDNETLKPNATYREAWVSGVHRDYISISAHQHSEEFVIQFKAFGAHPFLHLPMYQLADKVVSGDEILDGVLLDLREDLYTASSSSDKFAVAEGWLNSRFDKKLAPPTTIVDVIVRLQAEPASKLKEIISSYSGTHKHLISQFKKFVGIPPKHFQRILRFNDVFIQMQTDQFLSWADIANSCGYSDQSHFIREFKKFSGFNPESYLSEEFEDDTTNFFPLDRDG
jgi:AraC-like DNA-binding protein